MTHPPAPRSRNALAEFLQGVHDIWRGVHFTLSHPVLWIWALIPFLLNFAFFTLLAWLLWHFGGAWIQGHFFAPGHGFWTGVVGWVLSVLIWLLIGLLIYFLFVPLATLIAAPFNDVLSEKVERLYVGQTVEQGFSPKLLVKSIAIGLHSSLRLTLLSLLLLVVVLPLNLIPGIGNLLWSGASAAITIRFLSLQFTAYSMDRRFYTYRQRREFLRHNRARTIGLGAMAFLIMLVPGLNALFIPVSAVAGTLLFCDARRSVGGDRF